MKDIITDEIALSERALEIDTQKQATELREITHEIKDTMRQKGYSSLSAPAIGYGRRVFCIDFKDLEIKTFINPVIVNAKGIELSRETSLTIPGKEFIRPRNNDITIMYQTPTGKIETRQMVGMAAKVVQQEIDMLEGISLADIGLELDENWDKATQEEREEVLAIYLDSLDLKQKEVQKQIEEDPELKQISDASKFLQSVQEGKTKLEGQVEMEDKLKKETDLATDKLKKLEKR